MLRRVFLSLALGLAASCAQAQTAPSPADVGISKGTPDVFKLKGHDNAWTPFGTVSPSTHIFVPGTNGNIAPNDCVKWGPGLTSAGAACNSVTGGAHPANQLTIYTNHAGLLANVTTPTEAWTVQQQGFYAPGDGGEASYNWDAASLCPGGRFGTPPATAADGVSCILPIGQSPSTPGRYILSFPSGSINARMFGFQPGIGTAFDNSPLVDPMMRAMGPAAIGPTGPDIVFPATLGQIYTAYYFSQPFELSAAVNIVCGNSANTSQFGSKVEFIFPAGIAGIEQENYRIGTWGSSIYNSVNGCSVGSLGRFANSDGAGNADTGSNILRNVVSGPPVAWAGADPLLAPGDGVAITSLIAEGGMTLVQPGAYIQSVVPGSGGSGQDITLAPPYVIGKQPFLFGHTLSGTPGIYRMPADEKYQVATTAGSSNVVITGGKRPIKVGAWIWSEAFVYGTVLYTSNNQVITSPLPTVNSGGSGYGSGTGTMTYNAANLSGCSVAPVLNVTASGGVITAVTGVANVGRCDGGWISSSNTGWLPGGGLSAGSGATFNLAFANHAGMDTVAGSSRPSPALTGKTGTYNLWTLNAGIIRRTGAGTRSTFVQEFPIELELYCDNGGGFGTGCASSSDYNDSLMGGLVGRYVVGSDCSPSISMGNVYDRNFTTDILEACSLQNVYISENPNTPENHSGRYSILFYCGTLNNTVFIGGYWAFNDFTDGVCMGNDINGNPNIGVPPLPYDVSTQTSALSIGTIGIGGQATYGARGVMTGQFTFNGYSSKSEIASGPVAPGGTTITLNSLFNMIYPGMTVTDATNPAAIPSGTTITAINGGTGTITISNPVAAPGVSTNDKIWMSTSASPCVGIVGGVDLLFSMSAACGLSNPADDFGMTYIPSIGAWTIGSGASSVLMPNSSYVGYRGDQNLVALKGIAVNNDSQGGLGSERLITMGAQAGLWQHPAEGNFQFNSTPTAGGTVGWQEVSIAQVQNTTPIVAGTTTSIGLTACPTPVPAVGSVVTLVDSPTVGAHTPLGTFASCASSTLQLQAAATNGVATTNVSLHFLAVRPSGRIANDANATSYLPANKTNIASLVACGGNTVGLGVVTDGQTAVAAGYNAAIGAGGGGTTRLVFCDGTSWTYH